MKTIIIKDDFSEEEINWAKNQSNKKEIRRISQKALNEINKKKIKIELTQEHDTWQKAEWYFMTVHWFLNGLYRVLGNPQNKKKWKKGMKIRGKKTLIIKDETNLWKKIRKIGKAYGLKIRVKENREITKKDLKETEIILITNKGIRKEKDRLKLEKTITKERINQMQKRPLIINGSNENIDLKIIEKAFIEEKISHYAQDYYLSTILKGTNNCLFTDEISENRKTRRKV